MTGPLRSSSSLLCCWGDGQSSAHETSSSSPSCCSRWFFCCSAQDASAGSDGPDKDEAAVAEHPPPPLCLPATTRMPTDDNSNNAQSPGHPSADDAVAGAAPANPGTSGAGPLLTTPAAPDAPRPPLRRTVGEEEIDAALAMAADSAEGAASRVALLLRDAEVLEVRERRDLGRTLTAAVRAARDSETLREIVLVSCGITDAGARALAEGLPVGLQTLDLDWNEIGDAGVEALAGQLPMGLKALSLQNEYHKVTGVEALAKWLPSGLESLRLRSTSIGEVGVRSLAAKGRLAGLQKLTLDNAGLGDEGTCALAELLPATLQKLSLSHNVIGAVGARALAKGLPAGLRSLDLGCNKLADDGMCVLARALPVELQMLHIGQNHIGAKGVCMLAGALPAGLQVLDLGSNKFENEGAEALAGRLPRGLQSLGLSECDITAAGATALARGLPTEMLGLDLCDNKVGSTGIEALARALPAGLQTLDLDKVGMGDEGVRILAKWLPTATGLQVLELRQNNIGDGGISALAQALPPKLSRLALDGNNFGDEGTRALVGRLPSGMETLHWSSSGIGAESVHQLAEGLPQGLRVLTCPLIGDMGVEALMSRPLPSGLQTLLLCVTAITDRGVRALTEGLPLGLQELHLYLRTGAEGEPPGLQVMDGNWFGAEGVSALPAGLRWLVLRGFGVGAEGARQLARSLPAGLQVLELDLDDQAEEDFLGWLGGVKERLPCPGALLSVFRDFSRRDRATLVCEEMWEREAALETLRQLWPGEWPQAMDIRVLLCGNGLVGKTCLRRSLMREQQLEDDPRTMGVEVADIETANGLRFSIWDFGGQEEFHLLHSYLMPDTSYAAGKTSLFVLVLKLCHGINVEDSLDQLDFWFRLIASTSGLGQMRQLAVVLNQWEGGEDRDILVQLNGKVEELKDKYVGRVKVHDTWVFNARGGLENESIQTFWRDVTELAKDLLSDQRVPNICLDIIARLPDLRRTSREAPGGMPIMKRSDFAKKVMELLPQEGAVMDWVHGNKDKFFDAVLQYLQDAGQIVSFDDELGDHHGRVGDRGERGWVVVDPSWLGSNVAGGLLGLRLREADQPWVAKGEVSVALLKHFYESQGQMEWKMVRRLLEEFNLCYEVRGRKQAMLFVPSLLNPGGQEAFQRWSRPPLSDHVLGYCLGPADTQGEGGGGGEGLFILGICFFQRLQTILATTMEPDLLGGGHDLANDHLTSYFGKLGAAFLLKYDMDRDQIFLLTRPIHPDCSREVLVSLLESVSDKLIKLAARERKAVPVAKKILPPLCAKTVSSARLALLRPDGAYTEGYLRKMLGENSNNALTCLDRGEHSIRVAELLSKEAQAPSDEEGSVYRKLKSLQRQLESVKQIQVKTLHGLPGPLPRLCYLEDTCGRKMWRANAKVFFHCEGDGNNVKSHGVLGAQGLSLQWNTAGAEKIKSAVKYALCFTQGALTVAAILSPIGPVVLPIAATAGAAAVTGTVQQAAQYSHRPGEWLSDKKCQWRELWEAHVQEPAEVASEEEPQSADLIFDPEEMRLFTATVLEEVFGRPDLTIGLQVPEVDRLKKKCGIFRVKISEKHGSLEAGDVAWVCKDCKAKLEAFALPE